MTRNASRREEHHASTSTSPKGLADRIATLKQTDGAAGAAEGGGESLESKGVQKGTEQAGTIKHITAAVTGNEDDLF